LREQLDERFGMETMIGQSPALREVFETIRQVAGSRANVLITGETGTGKELVAQAVHRLSPRVNGPFITVHCAALSPTLLESELFGHEKGAFTGATDRRPGRFERADGGTIFLDEIGEIDASVQVKILRVLEQHTFERVGGRETLETDARLIVATNKDLAAMVKEGKFREDLFYRLNVVTIQLPPLRERREDIPLLVQKFLAEFNKENNKEVEGLTSDAMAALLEYNWPGNIRELRNAVERMVVLSRQNRLTVRDLPPALRPAGGTETRSGPLFSGAMTLADTEKHLILRALEQNEGHRTRAAEQLGISRRTLHRKLREYGVTDAEDTP
jgi:DNA-binding NtrC family response regulator